MAVEGYCNCRSIKVGLPAMPSESLLCHCSNCRRAGGATFSVNYLVDLAVMEVNDPKNVLKSYSDSNTVSGNTITRKFCGNCGSPVFSVLSPDNPKIFLKGGLFDDVAPPAAQYFTKSKMPWVNAEIATQDAK
ncbi:hypothetical protein EJ04DRAFT_177177 [Polyplosphaeria fusca]|uniref:CENP-V/GFA domain-containing protein n=1 Tax=Polyplosphaeria fusca TaxID=682080 RepID=A0A9P4V463_9PLEO|nr:hypothetical protein EJ04DRAFT_177177 [Polyplosphaeria fusca]